MEYILFDPNESLGIPHLLPYYIEVIILTLPILVDPLSSRQTANSRCLACQQTMSIAAMLQSTRIASCYIHICFAEHLRLV